MWVKLILRLFLLPLGPTTNPFLAIPICCTRARWGVCFTSPVNKSCPVVQSQAVLLETRMFLPSTKGWVLERHLAFAKLLRSFEGEKNGFSFGNLLAYYLWRIKPFSFHFHLCFLWVTSSIAALDNIKWSCLPDITDPNSFCEKLEENKLDQMESACVNYCLDLAVRDVAIWSGEFLYLISWMLNLSV